MRHCTCAVSLAAATLTLATAPRAQFFDWMPATGLTDISTDSQVLIPTNGPPQRFDDGIFVFRNVTIPRGVEVRGRGTKPMIWLVTGRFVVDGTLSVDGDDGQRVNTLNSANFPSLGGLGQCGGGNGGMGSPNFASRSLTGQRGGGAFAMPGMDGFGGGLSCGPGAEPGGGGGGGSFGTVGDPFFLNGTGAPQLSGVGGTGFAPTGLGGMPGPAVFVDGLDDNDFIGTGIDWNRRRLVTGELQLLRGGQGGGGGGDKATNCSPTDPNFANDQKGGGGGGGGGCLIIYALGEIVVGPEGRITANGGTGGGGELAGANTHGGGGGGGAGGLIILASNGRITLHTHGETYLNGDTSFSVAADGGFGEQGDFRNRPILDKYRGRQFLNQSATGGFGGLGVVQLMTPPGGNADGTNTILDDRIDIVDGGSVLTGTRKQRYLAWRGYLDGQGVRVDDMGNPTNIMGAGDIRPTPALLPLF